jgi:hypothetical protein
MLNDKNRPWAEVLRQAATGLDGIKDLATKGTQLGRAEVEVQLRRREHRRALAQLGQAVLDSDDDLPPSLGKPLQHARDAEVALAAAERTAKQAWQPGRAAPVEEHDDALDPDDDD